MKLSKEQKEQHKSALKVLEKNTLSAEDKKFIYENYIPAYNNRIDISGAFFTPASLVNTFLYAVTGNKVIDLCAGIGALSFGVYHFRNKSPEITCIEINPEYLEVGKKLLPEANWILGDVTDRQLIKSLGTFDCVVSNPPFGNIMANKTDWLNYTQNAFDLKVVEIGSLLAPYGIFILPQANLPFLYSGIGKFEERENQTYQAFLKKTKIEFEVLPINTSDYAKDWLRKVPTVEIVSCEFPTVPSKSEQLTLEFT